MQRQSRFASLSAVVVIATVLVALGGSATPARAQGNLAATYFRSTTFSVPFFGARTVTARCNPGDTVLNGGWRADGDPINSHATFSYPEGRPANGASPGSGWTVRFYQTSRPTVEGWVWAICAPAGAFGLGQPVVARAATNLNGFRTGGITATCPAGFRSLGGPRQVRGFCVPPSGRSSQNLPRVCACDGAWPAPTCLSRICGVRCAAPLPQSGNRAAVSI
jgi:hypothetical protein